MNYQDYIKTELLVLVPVLYFMGIGLKKSFLPDRWIPIVLGSTAIVLSALWVFATTDISGIQECILASFTAVTQGVLTAGASVYFNQLYVQSNKKE